MVGAYKPCAEFIKLAHRLKLNPVFVNISFVGANALAKELGEDGKGVVVTQVVPFPWRHEPPACGSVPKSAQGGESRRADRLRLARGIHGRPIGC